MVIFKTLAVFGFAFLVLFSLPESMEAQEEAPEQPRASGMMYL